MARSHKMTPARRAALRKAQLASARKRRKRNTVGSTVRRATRQRAQYASASLRTRTAKKRGRGRKVMRYTAIGAVGLAAAVAAAPNKTSGRVQYSKVKSTASKGEPRIRGTHGKRSFAYGVKVGNMRYGAMGIVKPKGY